MSRIIGFTELARRRRSEPGERSQQAARRRELHPGSMEGHRLGEAAAMNGTITRRAVGYRTTELIRRLGGLEQPAAGTWSIRGSHAGIEFSLSRPLHRTERCRGRASEGAIVFGQAPDYVLVEVLFESGLSPLTRTLGAAAASSCHLVAGASAGPLQDAAECRWKSAWAVSGEVRANNALLPVHATLGYHGVWRQGDHAYGWFTLAGEVVTPPAAGRRSMRFSFDLVADSPNR